MIASDLSASRMAACGLRFYILMLRRHIGPATLILRPSAFVRSSFPRDRVMTSRSLPSSAALMRPRAVLIRDRSPWSIILLDNAECRSYMPPCARICVPSKKWLQCPLVGGLLFWYSNGGGTPHPGPSSLYQTWQPTHQSRLYQLLDVRYGIMVIFISTNTSYRRGIRYTKWTWKCWLK